MLQKNVLIYYFSGTGNTKRLAEHFQNYLIQKGYKVDLRAMEKYSSVDIPDNTTLGMAFPIAVQSTFPLVWDFIYKLPDVKKIDVFMFDTMAAFSGGVIGPLKKLLTKKGYNCIGAEEFKMSSSINTNPSKVEKGRVKNLKALSDIEKFAENLIEGKAEWGRIPVLSGIVRLMSKPRILWTESSKKISVNDGCIKCMICVKNCPVSAISLKNDKIIIDHKKCNACMKCVANCPKKAILYDKKRLYLS